MKIFRQVKIKMPTPDERSWACAIFQYLEAAADIGTVAT